MSENLKNEILELVKSEDIIKPTRYLGGEINAIIKPDMPFKFVMCFADMYEIAISNLGLSILYEVINSIEYASCERVYAVAEDFEKLLKEKNIPLYTLETFSRVKDADILGFTLQYELIYTNILQVLELSQIPIHREERGEDVPIIAAGGPSVFNPFPLADFIDVFLFGEFDFEMKNFVDIIYNLRKNGAKRDDILKELSKLEYAYVPKYPREHVKRIFVENINEMPYVKKPLVPLVEGIQNRISVEIARGCTHSCRFCLAGITYRPVRNRTIEKIVKISMESLEATGANTLNLFSLSADDYPHIGELIEYLQTLGEYKGFSLSLPSLRIDSFDKDTADRIAQFRKTGLTFALEVGSHELREKINKEMDEDAIYNILADVQKMGWKIVKIYFMIGFTDNPDKEADEIIEALEKMIKVSKNKVKINAAINVFIPKSHTPLENNNQLTDEEAIIHIGKVRDHFRGTKVAIKYHPPRMAEIEGIISRGDEKIGDIIYKSYKKGAKFDAWVEYFNYDIWKEVIEESGYTIKELLSKKINMPWKCIDTLVSQKFFDKEYERFQNGKFTDYCFTGNCQNCGIDYKKYCHKYKKEVLNTNFTQMVEELKTLKKRDIFAVNYKILMKFKKEGISSLLGMHDLSRVMICALKIAGASIALSKGFHPLEKVVFTPPTPFACESEAEYMEISLTDAVDIELLKNKINNLLSHIGIEIISAVSTPLNIKNIQSLPKNTVYKIITNDDKKAFDILSNKEELNTSEERKGDYLLINKDDNLLITLLESKEKAIRVRDIKSYLSKNNINIKNIRKLELV
ncbi:TIGR03960 family B12-binding radical SAM protein [uncultured Brachyspira sp.]|uniref:TIGR03960 family B12-binding radical SAM protein n=1 Tax=uncultured Brachyspira sp. TaxID=221953 RepID=UPI00261448A7|nr:TIGR03960 family B12-binding radical SAM protein [uncultured Brachyspira sp.]